MKEHWTGTPAANYRDFMSRDSQYKSGDKTSSATLDNLRCCAGNESLCQFNKFPILGFLTSSC